MRKETVAILSELRKVYGIHITIHSKDTKMDGIWSISTAVHMNELCACHSRVPGAICKHCYAKTYTKMRPGLRKCVEGNYKVLTRVSVPPRAWILLAQAMSNESVSVFRIESFGDIANQLHAENYWNLCSVLAFFGIRVGWWTKNAFLIARVLEKLGNPKIPENVSIIVSSIFENVKAEKRFYFVKRVFTVYDSKTIKAEGIDINCGSRHCLSCMKCYASDVDDIREKRK